MSQPLSASSSSKREDIIQLAYSVFDSHGFHETGIDKVLTESGISKRTVYRYFRSKEDLIAAAIAHYQHLTFAALTKALEKRARTARGKLLALFDLKQEELGTKNYSGCFAINAGLTYQGKNRQIKAASLKFLQDVERFIGQLCRESGCARPGKTAMQIMVLFQGTILHGQAHQNPAAAAASKDVVRELLK